MSYEDLMRLAMFEGNDDTALVRFRHAVKHARAADAEIAALTERLRIVEAERDEANTTIGNLLKPLDHIAKLIWGDTQGLPFAILGEAVATQLSALRSELEQSEATIARLRASIENMLFVMARRGRLDDGDWSKPINQMRAALENLENNDGK